MTLLQIPVLFLSSFKDGLPHGEGTLRVNGQWTYKGEFQLGRRSGKGKNSIFAIV